MARAIEAMRGKHPVAIADLPFLVRFRDERDPKTVEAVDPDNLAASFGEGVRLGSVTMEITDDPVTTGIEKRLPWVANLRGSVGKDMSLPAGDLRRAINDGSFWQGTLR